MNCEQCGKEFIQVNNRLKRFCSKKCREKVSRHRYYLMHKELCRERKRRWAARNPERARELIAKSARRYRLRHPKRYALYIAKKEIQTRIRKKASELNGAEAMLAELVTNPTQYMTLNLNQRRLRKNPKRLSQEDLMRRIAVLCEQISGLQKLKEEIGNGLLEESKNRERTPAVEETPRTIRTQAR
jgi:hypothetical protein